jgi:hypothetical protein
LYETSTLNGHVPSHSWMSRDRAPLKFRRSKSPYIAIG